MTAADYLNPDGTHHCTQCGACCRSIAHIVEAGLLPDYFDDGDGACIYLIDNRCSIFELRPSICRNSETPWTDEENAAGCARLVNAENAVSASGQKKNGGARRRPR